MKKILQSIAVFGLVAACAMPSFGTDANQMNYIEMLSARQQSQAVSNSLGTAVDVSAYKGNATWLVQIGPAAVTNEGTTTFTLQTSATESGTYRTATNIAGNAAVITNLASNVRSVGSVQEYAIGLSRLSKWARVRLANTSDTNEYSSILVAPMKSQ